MKKEVSRGGKLNQRNMKTTLVKNQKHAYCAPNIEYIILDNEISLVLESEPPIFPGEGQLKAPDYFNSDPYKFA